MIGTSLPQGRYLSALVSWTVSSRIGSRGPDADQDVARLDRSLPIPFTASMAPRSATNTFAEEILTGSTSKVHWILRCRSPAPEPSRDDRAAQEVGTAP